MKHPYIIISALVWAASFTAYADTGERGFSQTRFGHPDAIARKGVRPAEPAAHRADAPQGATPITAREATYNADGTLDIPFSLAPTQENVDKMIILDVQDDGRTWAYEAKEQALFYRYSTKLNADDYAVIPINVNETGCLFRFSVSARCQNGYFGEAFEMCAGASPTTAGLKPIFVSGMIYNEDYRTFDSYFAVPQPGTYYIALHMVSPKNCMRFYVRDIAVEKTEQSRYVPAECSGLALTAAPRGELRAEVSFTAPALHADGSPLPEGEQLSVTVSSPTESKTIRAFPGEEVNIEIATAQGENTIETVPSNGNGEGLRSTASLFTGPDVPTAPEVTTVVSADNMSMLMKMNVGSTGKNGGYVNPQEVEYTLHTYVEEGYSGSWQEMKKLGTVEEYTFELPAGTPQDVVNIGVTAGNAQGENTSVVSVSEVLGTPHPIPATETFAQKKFTYSPVVIEAPSDEYGADYTIINPEDLLEQAVNHSKLAMAGYITDYGATKGQIALPRFSTKGVSSASIGFNVYFHRLMPETSIEVSGVEMEPVTIGSFGPGTQAEGWHTIKFDLPADMLDREWIAPTVTSSYPGEDEEEYIIIDKYFLRPTVEHDLAVEAIYGADKLCVADKASYLAIIENRGEQSAPLTNAEFRIRRGGEVIATQAVTPVDIAPGTAVEATLEFTPTADHLGEISISLAIADSDDVTANNTCSIGITVEKGEQQIITDLQGHYNDESVELQWTPVGKLAGFQNMEKLSAFYYGSKLGEFTNVDADGKNTFVISGFKFPGNGYAKAFQVFNYPKSNVNSDAYMPWSGEQYLIAFAPDDEITAADDYLISPEIKGGTQLSFMFNIITGKFGSETVEILTSSTDNAPESFTLLRTITKDVSGWEKTTATLPNDAKYFALHYTSCNTFGIMIDDIDYIPAKGLPVVTYNIYRNGELLAADIPEAAYRDEHAPEGTNRYNVSASIDGREQPMSNTAIIATGGIRQTAFSRRSIRVTGAEGKIIISGLSGEHTAIYGSDGKTIASFSGKNGSVECPAALGIYIIRSGEHIFKIHLRR